MKLPTELSYAELLDIVNAVQKALYLDVDAQRIEVWNADKAWNPETLDQIAATLARHRLVPEP